MSRIQGRSKAIRVFTREDFFRPHESVYIHLSPDYPDFVGKLHKHEFIEIVYVTSGSAVHSVGKHSYPVIKGDLCIVNYGTPHAFAADEGGIEPFAAYDLMFTPDFLDSQLMFFSAFESISSSYLFYSLFPEEQPFQPDLRLTGSSYCSIGEIFSKIYYEYNAQCQGYIELIRAYTIELIVKIIRKMNAAPQHAISLHQKAVVDLALNYLRENYQNHVSIEALAGQVFLSKDYFSKLFKGITGQSVGIFLRQLRIDHACSLLASTNLAVNDIAAQCGYDDMKSFYSAFKRHKGATPGAYRQSIIKRQI